MRSYGTATVNFTSKVSKRRILEDFDDVLIRCGTVSLTSINGESIKLNIDDCEVVEAQDEDE